MPMGLSIKKAKKSKLTRIPFLPRFNVNIDIMGKRIEYTYAPVTEMFLNLYQEGFSTENFIKIVSSQFKEVQYQSSSTTNENSTPLEETSFEAENKSSSAE